MIHLRSWPGVTPAEFQSFAVCGLGAALRPIRFEAAGTRDSDGPACSSTILTV